MLTNISTVLDWDTCERRVLHSHHYNKQRPKGLALAIGSAFHNAIAAGLAKRDWDLATTHARENSAKEIAPLLEDFELYKLEEYTATTVAMVQAYRDSYEPIANEWQVLQPECKFLVPIPNSHHNCIAMHHFRVAGKTLYEVTLPGKLPSGEVIAKGNLIQAHEVPDPTCFCWQPHYLIGTTDAVVLNNNRIWLFEHKTTSSLSNSWWAQWALHKQPTAYLWGLWKTLGTLPAGVMFNAVRKPTEDQVKSWNSRRKNQSENKSISDYIQFERRPITRTLDDLQRFERQMIHMLNSWEHAMVGGGDYFPQRMNSHNCVQYNTTCPWMGACSEADTDNAEAILNAHFEPRENHYTDDALITITNEIRKTKNLVPLTYGNKS